MILCLPNIYRYGIDTFEFHRFLGPIRLKKDLSEHKVQSIAFFNRVQTWVDLSDEEKEKTRIYG
jgi:hypothetical protein